MAHSQWTMKWEVFFVQSLKTCALRSQNDGLWHVCALKKLRFNISLAQHLPIFCLAFGASPCRPAYEQLVPAKACIELKTPL